MIRLASKQDLEEIQSIYAIARSYMAANGNPTQWAGGYPSREILERDIEASQLFVCTEQDAIHGVFAFAVGPEETYAQLENGAWPNDEPYGTIHRIAGDGQVKGIFRECLQFCRGRIANLRIDTHEDNRIMQHLIEANGFWKCGIIHVRDNTPRLAYALAMQPQALRLNSTQ